ncbi:PIN domain-containing protein [bacterium]|nr:PIN domain-containing protein [bacterium]
MKKLRYWDSSCFLGWFNNEDDKVSKLKAVVQEAESGHVVIVTSTITLVEVFRMKNRPRIPQENEEIIQAFFDNPFISLRNVTPAIAIKARLLLLKYDWLRPYDATHAATALHYSVDTIDAFDSDILRLNEQEEFAAIDVAIPSLPLQAELDSFTEE